MRTHDFLARMTSPRSLAALILLPLLCGAPGCVPSGGTDAGTSDGGACDPGMACPEIYCEFGQVIDPTGCPTCECAPPPTCDPGLVCIAIYCEFGQVIDPTGCPTCECAPPPPCDAGPVCTLVCEHGLAPGPSGCLTCECAPPPPPVRLCRDDTDCAASGATGRCDTSVCYSAPCPSGMGCPTVCYGACGPASP